MATVLRLECNCCLLDLDLLAPMWGTSCGHVFHTDCISKIYADEKHECSFCRSEIDRIFPLHFEWLNAQQNHQNRTQVVIYDPYRLNQHGNETTQLAQSIMRLIELTPGEEEFHLVLLQLLQFLQ